MTDSALLNASLLTSALLLASVACSRQWFPDAKHSCTAFCAYAGFVFLCFLIGLQVIVGSAGLLTGFSVSLAGYTLSFLCLWSTRATWQEPFPLQRNLLLYGAFFFPLGAYLALELFNGLIFPVWEYDSVSYHLPIVRDWFVRESLRSVFFSVYAGPVGYYPGSGELLTLWPILLTGTDLFANLQNVFLAALFVPVSLHLTRRIGLPDRCGVLFPLLFLTSPIVLKEIGTPHIDLFLALTFLYVLLFTLEYARRPSAACFIGFFSALGLFVGSKYLALPIAALAVASFAVIVFRGGAPRNMPRLTALAVLTCVLLGGYWYIRNVMLTGNPVFPASLSVGSWQIWKGYGSMTKDLFSASILGALPNLSVGEVVHMTLQYIARTGFQTLLSFCTFVGVCIVSVRSRLSGFERYLLIATVTLSAWYVVTPNGFIHFDANIRYSILVLFHLALLVAAVSQRSERLWRLLMISSLVTVCFTLVYTLKRPDLPHELATLRLVEMFPDAAIQLGFRAAILGALLIIVFAYQCSWMIALCCLACPLLFWFGNEELWQIRISNQYQYLEEKYQAFPELIAGLAWLNENVDEDDTIAYTGFHFHYPLYGSDLRRDVHYVSVNECIDCDYFDYAHEPEGIFARASKEQWLENLETLGTDYLIVYNEFGYMKYEQDWVQHLLPAFEDGDVSIYILKQSF